MLTVKIVYFKYVQLILCQFCSIKPFNVFLKIIALIFNRSSDDSNMYVELRTRDLAIAPQGVKKLIVHLSLFIFFSMHLFA